MASELIERELYNSKYYMVHNPNAKGSSPRYKIIEPMVEGATKVKILMKPKGVTTILGQTLAKDFVGWALDCMEEVLKAKLPIITADDLTDAKQESERRKNSGAATGSITHALVEHFLKAYSAGQEPPEAESDDQEALKAYKAFVDWYNEHDVQIIGVEEVIFSEEYEYAGTYDCILKVDGKVYLCDLKTTNSSRKAPNGVYAEMFVQLGGYREAHEEQRAYEVANGGTKLLAVDGLMVISAKKNGKLDVVTNEDVGLTVEDCSEMFKKVVNLFGFLKYTTERLGGK